MIRAFTISFLFLTAIDAYAFRGIYPFLPAEGKGRWALIALYWAISLALSIGTLLFLFKMRDMRAEPNDFTVFASGLFFVVFIGKLAFCGFHLIDDVYNGIRYVSNRLFETPVDASRRRFISRVGLGFAGVLMGGLAYGVWKGKFAFRTLRHQLADARIPKNFDGFKIVQISDAHLGSFARRYEELNPLVEMINALEADILVFTGDMVNNHAAEAEGWEEVFGAMQAKEGKYSVFGNHDYAHYGPYDEQEREDSMNLLRKVQKDMGFHLLEDEHVRIKRGEEGISLVGVHNWGKGFGEYGKLDTALGGIEKDDFKVLLSHDPTHFEHQVLGKEDIALTLSGHTHGMQMGIEIPSIGIKWSPVKFRYKRWAGMYEESGQRLHVNRGMGVLAYPGRLGMAPEVTLIELKSLA